MRIRSTSRLAPLVLAAALAPRAVAQIDLEWSFVAPYVSDTHFAAWADLDGDGLEDVLVGTRFDNVIVWSRNLGAGQFGQYQVVERSVLELTSLDVADLDGDGNLDIITGEDDPFGGPAVGWYRGLGGGEFEAQQAIDATSTACRRVRAADVDLDGDQDLVATHQTPQGVYWYENLGGGVFGAPSAIAAPPLAASAGSFAVTDADMDGDIDVAFVDFSSDGVYIVENLGGGNFATPTIVASIFQPRAVGFGDVDGDGNVDLVAAGRNEIVWAERTLPSGFSWLEQDRASTPRTAEAIEVTDLDGDGVDEIVMSETVFGARIYGVDPGTGVFLATPPQLLLDAESDVVVADVNADGLLDLISPGNECEVALGELGGGFAFPGSLVSPYRGVEDYVTTDFDRDGDLDIIAATQVSGGPSSAVVFHERLTDDRFALPRPLTDLATSAELPGLADLDGDGNDDLYFARRITNGSPFEYRLACRFGVGAGVLGPEQVLAGPFPNGIVPYRPADATDLDGDGDLDLILSVRGSNTPLDERIYSLFNDGNGQFPNVVIAAEEQNIFVRSVADMDGDGTLDLLVEVPQIAARILPGDPASPTGFAMPIDILAMPLRPTQDITSLDFDADGDEDLIVVIQPPNGAPERFVGYENLGTGYGPRQVLFDLQFRGPLYPAIDWDLDGDKDLVLSNGFNRMVSWLEVEPGGPRPLAVAFEAPAMQGFSGIPYFRFQDVDGDGDVDFWASLGRGFRLVSNVSELGTTACEGDPNSTGVGASVSASGSDEADENQMVLTGTDLPPGAAMYFLVSRTTGSSQPPTSQGTLCLGGSIGRYSRPEQIRFASASGIARLRLDLTMTPDPMLGVGPAVAGETLYFQGWYRDANPIATSNFTGTTGVLLR